MDIFRKYFSKRQCVVALNLGAIFYLAITDRLSLTPRSLFGTLVALAALNIGGHFSLKHYPKWK
jgi:hypothetical protein